VKSSTDDNHKSGQSRARSKAARLRTPLANANTQRKNTILYKTPRANANTRETSECVRVDSVPSLRAATLPQRAVHERRSSSRGADSSSKPASHVSGIVEAVNSSVKRDFKVG